MTSKLMPKHKKLSSPRDPKVRGYSARGIKLIVTINNRTCILFTVVRYCNYLSVSSVPTNIVQFSVKLLAIK